MIFFLASLFPLCFMFHFVPPTLCYFLCSMTVRSVVELLAWRISIAALAVLAWAYLLLAKTSEIRTSFLLPLSSPSWLAICCIFTEMASYSRSTVTQAFLKSNMQKVNSALSPMWDEQCQGELRREMMRKERPIDCTASLCGGTSSLHQKPPFICFHFAVRLHWLLWTQSTTNPTMARWSGATTVTSTSVSEFLMKCRVSFCAYSCWTCKSPV
jgi:hypothetical protein